MDDIVVPWNDIRGNFVITETKSKEIYTPEWRTPNSGNIFEETISKKSDPTWEPGKFHPQHPSFYPATTPPSYFDLVESVSEYLYKKTIKVISNFDANGSTKF